MRAIEQFGKDTGSPTYYFTVNGNKMWPMQYDPRNILLELVNFGIKQRMLYRSEYANKDVSVPFTCEKADEDEFLELVKSYGFEYKTVKKLIKGTTYKIFEREDKGDSK